MSLSISTSSLNLRGIRAAFVAILAWAANVIDTASSQTLSNKTLAAPIFTGTQRQSNTTAAVAAAGSTVADAASLPDTSICHISSDSAAKGVKLLPVTAGGVIRYVINDSATAAKLYAESTGTTNGQAADAAVAIPASKGCFCISTAAKTWLVYDFAAKSTNA